MQIYTGQTSGANLARLKEFGLGIMLSSHWHSQPIRDYGEVPCALDNGAFTCYRKGYPFQADVFRATMRKAFECNIELDFIVCPDIVCGGLRSLAFSMEWAKGELQTAPRLALVVQDGMAPKEIMEGYHLPYFSHIFVGGSVDWKWRTAREWVLYAHENGLKAHIGQCGQLSMLERAQELGADSVDSTSFVRNGSWHIIEKFLGCTLVPDLAYESSEEESLREAE